jgi:hypothetical protein
LRDAVVCLFDNNAGFTYLQKVDAIASSTGALAADQLLIAAATPAPHLP